MRGGDACVALYLSAQCQLGDACVALCWSTSHRYPYKHAPLFTKRRHKPMSNSPIPIKEFELDLSELTYTDHDLVRPESILAKPNGTLWVSDGRGGVTRIDPDGQQTFLGGRRVIPNKIAMADD